jgi:aspartyl-tRNA(Asn)/glutamyl-tRNA(Gln) amidotransferase subunit A
MALGTDTGGSVRIPASLCGVVGLKPTAGLVSTTGVMPLSTTLDHVGPIAPSVPECARLLSVLSGENLASLEEEPGSLCIGVLSGFGLEPDVEVAKLFGDALELLAEAGHSLEPVSIPRLSDGLRILSRIYAPEAARYHLHRLQKRPDDFGDEVRADLERGVSMSEDLHEQALAERNTLAIEIDTAMQGLDLLISPATPRPARPIGSPGAHTYLAFTCAFNLTGQPAISVPMGRVGGLPVGLQLVGHRLADDLVLRAACSFERLREPLGS